MKTKQYNELKEKIIEAVPEIMELKQPEFSNYVGLCDKVFGRKDNGDVNFPQYGCQAEDIFNKMKEGRLITLIDILKTRKDLAIDGLGGIFEIRSSNKAGTLWEFKFLGHCEPNIPLQDQSEETIELLYNLICKK